MTKPVAEPGFMANPEIAIKLALEATTVQSQRSLIVAEVSRSERSEDGGVRVLPLAKVGWRY
eukprot:1188198-Amphidinium_carterae.1